MFCVHELRLDGKFPKTENKLCEIYNTLRTERYYNKKKSNDTYGLATNDDRKSYIYLPC